MKMNSKGKVSFSTIIFFVVLIYGGFVAYKILAARVTMGQIKKEIVDKIGFIRGQDFDKEKGEEIAWRILRAHDVDKPAKPNNLPPPSTAGSSDSEKNKKEELPIVEVTVDKKASKIYIYVKYDVILDFLIFKQHKVFEIDEEMRSYS